MLFALPPVPELYDALLARDASYDGRAYVGVTSTGIFCRLTCPARKPKRENCRFFASVPECLAAGFRACKRCSPLAPAAASDPAIRTLLGELEKRPGYRWSEVDVERMGFDPSTVRRSFRRQFGMTFLEMARMERLRAGFQTLGEGGRVIDAQIEAGFESPEAFRVAFAKLAGVSPGKLAKEPLLGAHWLDTPLGAMVAICDEERLHLLEFADRKGLPTEAAKLHQASRGTLGIARFAIHDRLAAELGRYFDGRPGGFSIPLALHGSAFTRAVWAELIKIPPGETRSYSGIADALGEPLSVRAVARANGANQIAILIPCHRVIGADGSLTNYGGGLWRKQKLIDIERQLARAAL